jgi:hypothetical protein
MNTNFEIFMTFEYIFETFPFNMYGKRHEPDSIVVYRPIPGRESLVDLALG